MGIHAAQAPVNMIHVRALYDAIPSLQTHPLFGPDAIENLPRGAVVATATLVDCVRSVWSGFDPHGADHHVQGRIGQFRHHQLDPHGSDYQMMWTHEDETGDEILEYDDGWGDYSSGRWIWRFTDVEPLDPPIPATGRQRVWHWAHRADA